MTRALLLSVLLATLVEGGAAAGGRRSIRDEADLLSGAALGLPEDAHSSLSRGDIFSLDDDMRAFVTERAATGDAMTKLTRLLDGMSELGLFALDYTVEETSTARTSFHNRRGNCLSFTLLFVTLAREAGLDVRYQVVDVPPSWSDDSDLVVINRHIDALVEIPHASQYVVDFNIKDFKTHYPRHVVSDEHALALFYNNIGAEALIRKEFTRAFLNLRAAVITDPKLSGAWANLGLLYWRIARSELAEAAYRKALSLDPDDGSALTNLTSLYTELGRTELAAEFRERVHDYQLANPYYHFALARRAYEAQRFDDTLRALRNAIRRKRNEPRFYELQGRAYVALGRSREAQKSFERARRYAPPEQRSSYGGETTALTADDATNPQP